MGSNGELPFMYKDISHGKFIQWLLGYTFPLIVSVADRIPREQSWNRPTTNIDPVAWILGGVVNNEDSKLSLLTGKEKISQKTLDRFGCPANTSSMSPELEEGIDRSVVTVDFLLDTWISVRNRTNAYLESIPNANLKDIPKRRNRDNHDPVREEFVMLAYQQNLAFGKMLLCEQMLTGDKAKTAFPSFSKSSKHLMSKYKGKYTDPSLHSVGALD